MSITTVAVDLAKSVFELAFGDGLGRVTGHKRLSKDAFAAFFVNMPPCRVVMEACGTAHDWARTLQALGHEVRLLPLQHVRRNKTDRADAEALLEADRCGGILPVPPKEAARQALQGWHRLRQGWMATRTARINAVRGLLREFSHDLPQGPAAVLERVPAWLVDEAFDLPPALRQALRQAMDEIKDLESRIAEVEKLLRQEARQRQDVARLLAVPGIGLLTATALAAAVGNMEAFRDGRHLAAWLGLTPRENTAAAANAASAPYQQARRPVPAHLAGSRRPLGPARRAGETGGGQAADPPASLGLAGRLGHNRAVCALANKMARIAFAVVRLGRDFDGDFVPAKPGLAGQPA